MLQCLVPARQLWWFITDGMITAPGYPASIQVPHAMATMWRFRRSYSEKEWNFVSIWHMAIGAYFCHGYGGSTARDLVLGVAPSAAAHPTVVAYFLLYVH